MNQIANSICALVGNTPLLRLHKLEYEEKITTELIAKVEYFNPLGSVKDRVALAMVEQAEHEGTIEASTVIIEPTSGNTGIGLAFVCAAKGYRLLLTMPENMSDERKLLLRTLGAELVLTDASLGMSGAIKEAERLKKQYPNAWIPAQFDNPTNPAIHQQTTAKEIWEGCDGCLNGFVAGIGTGGTISGVGRYLKQHNPNISVFGVEPDRSAVLSGDLSGPHKLQGIGAGFVPSNYDPSTVDHILRITDEEAYAMTRKVATLEGLLVGISSGAALCAAVRVAKQKDFSSKRLVVLLPDSGQRYLSVPHLYQS